MLGRFIRGFARRWPCARPVQSAALEESNFDGFRDVEYIFQGDDDDGGGSTESWSRRDGWLGPVTVRLGARYASPPSFQESESRQVQVSNRTALQQH